VQVKTVEAGNPNPAKQAATLPCIPGPLAPSLSSPCWLWCKHLCSDTKDTWWKLTHQNKIKSGKFSTAVQPAVTQSLDWKKSRRGVAVVGKTARVRRWGTVCVSFSSGLWT